MDSFGEKVIAFHHGLKFNGQLPEGISVMNPYHGNPETRRITGEFYRKYFSDNARRHIILGINPGRHGAGVTGIPFTDTIRLKEYCGIVVSGFESKELSSAFVYDMISRMGGSEEFYSRYYISAVCPLGFTRTSGTGREVNYNYYDSPDLINAVNGFIVSSLYKQLDLGIKSDVCFCLGTGKNFSFLSKLNEKLRLFGRIIPLEHPRFIMQYRLKHRERYIRSYISGLDSVKKEN